MLITHDTPSLGYKRQLAKRFDRASHSYDAYAGFQKIVLERLLAKLPVETADTVLDLGTGTGQALGYLSGRLTPKNCVALDLSQQMLAVASDRFSSLQNTHYVCADAEQLPFQVASFDLIFSSLAIQWCLSPERLFDQLYHVLKPGGCVVFSTLLEGSMPEISQAWSSIDDKAHVHQYMKAKSLFDCVENGRLRLLSSECANVPMWFDSPEKAIHSLKKVGASLISSDESKTLPPSAWKHFLREYEKQRSEQGIPLSYQVAFVVAQKPMYVQE
ncbi:malonyl-ACP O-methyltransferase BioC [Marinomonas profundimaris]|uniref:Malonyl-[acyl-carrier protein] O-methyltransferase n=1 Tax=Marinomonas profundimaris TaxID=1208321 RepID=W1RX25_9GAMM|nr:malonyl-ACP O-methyltransferase BioC [Marinomonas profundimaris]ETI61537.1 malonyl-CoA O-methyltransferase [Marinomonas profundimaris]